MVDTGKMYALTQDERGQLYLEVVVGGFAMVDVVVPLNEEETAAYKREGKPYLDELSLRICKSPELFRGR